MRIQEASNDALRERIRRGDQDEAARRLDADGYVVIRRFLEPAAIDSLRDDITATTRGLNESFGEPFTPAENLDEPLVELIDRHPDARSLIYDRLQQVPSVLALPNAPPIRALAEYVLGSDCIGVWPRVQVRLDSYLSERELIEWHSDFVYNRGTERSVTFWIPVSDISFEMGPIKIAAGSHTQSFDFIHSKSGRRHNLTLGDDDIRRLDIVQPTEYRAGDLVLMDSRTVHSGVLNTVEKRARLVCLFRMQDLTALETGMDQTP